VSGRKDKIKSGISAYVEENKKAINIIVWIWKEFIDEGGKKLARKVFVLMVLVSLAGLLGSLSVRLIFDGLNLKDDTLLLSGFILFSSVLIGSRHINYRKQILREHFFASFGKSLSRRVSQLFFQKSLGVHVSDNNVLNESNVRKGHDRVMDLVNKLMFEGVEAILALSFAYLGMWFVGAKIGLIILCLIVVYIAWSGFQNYRVMTDGRDIEEKWRFLFRYRSERWQQTERVKNNSKELEELEELDRHYDDAIIPDTTLWLWFIKSGYARGIINAIVFLLISGYGVREVWMGNMTIGWLYPLIFLGMEIIDNLWRVGDLERIVHYNLQSITTLKRALDLPVGITFKDNPSRLSVNSLYRVEFDSVSYRFKDDPKLPFVLNNISFTIEPHEKVALVGTSGAGKTTLMKLLLRYMDPTSGSIKIDGRDLRDLDLGAWLSMVGYIPQQPQVLNGTLRYNALYGLSIDGLKDISDEYLWEKVRMLQVDFGERLTEGLDTKIGYNGLKLSGGQNQRLMILAAAMKGPRIMAIDEATNSLDPSTEKLVQAGLEKVLSNDCGALIIAHRLSTVRMCDKIIVIEPVNGSGSSIVGVGKSFGELYETCSQFRKLADDQELRI